MSIAIKCFITVQLCVLLMLVTLPLIWHKPIRQAWLALAYELEGSGILLFQTLKLQCRVLISK